MYQVKRLETRDYISALPDEILCDILSLLTLRDSIRTRLVSKRWRYLCDHRAVLVFDTLNVFGSGSRSGNKSDESEFVRAVDQFLSVWRGWNLSGVEIVFGLGNEHAWHINRWLSSLFPKKLRVDQLRGSLQDAGKLSYLQCFHLRLCGLALSPECTHWISHVSSLELAHVRLHKCILSGAFNLTSLSLKYCRFGQRPSRSFVVELPRLKELFLKGDYNEIGINCPNLESLRCQGCFVQNFKFSHLPLLRKVDLRLKYLPQGYYSLTFDSLTRQAPQLQVLSLSLSKESWWTSYTRQHPQREYSDCPHHHLKEVQIVRETRNWVEMELARYLLRNAVVLQRMVIKENKTSYLGEEITAKERQAHMAATLLHGINTGAELIWTMS